jgi:hypothetical protein
MSLTIDTGTATEVKLQNDTLTPAEYLAVIRSVWWQSHAQCYKWDEKLTNLERQLKAKQ